jgi:hypothetical protein
MVVAIALEVVENATFIRLKIPTRLAKTTKEKDTQWLNDASSRSNLKK